MKKKIKSLRGGVLRCALMFMMVLALSFAPVPMLIQTQTSWLTCLAAAPAVNAQDTADAYTTLEHALAVTHAAGPFRLRGEETTITQVTADGKTNRSTRYYGITGYDADASETYLQFESRIPDPATGKPISGILSTRTAFLVTPAAVYSKTSSPPTDWTKQDIALMLPKFITLGTLDQFFMLELLNGGRLQLYKDYLSYGADADVNGADCRTVKADINRVRFPALAEELTRDVNLLLGSAAEGMTEQQLMLLQKFAQGMLANLDAEAHYTFYIEKESGRVTRIEARMDMSDPYGDKAPGKLSRIKSQSHVELYDFGKAVTRVTL